MPRQVLVWPARFDVNEARISNPDALAYADEADAAYATLTGNPADVWCRRDLFDIHDQQVTAFFGPSGGEWNGQPIPEPSECLAARANAVLVTTVDWPEEEV